MASTEETSDGKYSIIAPNYIYPNRKYNVAIALHHTTQSNKIKLQLEGPSIDDTKLIDFDGSESKIIEFHISDLIEGPYNLSIEGIEGDLKFQKKIELSFMKSEPIVRVQTDKTVYRPGDVVKFWVLFLDDDYRPTTPWPNASIWIEMNHNTIVKRYDNLNVINGVYANEFQLLNIPHISPKWRISVKNSGHRRTEYFPFTVGVHDVETFLIDIESESKISIKDDKVPIVVKAYHPFGAPVNGKVTVTVRNLHLSEDDHSHDLKATLDLIDGKAKFIMDFTPLQASLSFYLTHFLIQITAQVEENESGAKRIAYRQAHLFPQRYEMKSLSDHVYYPDKETEKVIQILNIDGSRIQDTATPVQLSCTQMIYAAHGPNEKSLPMPEIEKTKFIFTGHLNELSQVVVNIKLPDLTDYAGHVHHFQMLAHYGDEVQFVGNAFPYRDPENDNVRPKMWEGPQLTIEKDKTSFKIGNQGKFSIKTKEPMSHLIYNVIARNALLISERIDLPNKPTSYDLRLEVTREMAPQAKLLVYHVSDYGHLYSKEETFDVDIELRNDIVINIPTDQVGPGDEVTLHLETSPNSLIGLRAIDLQSLHYGSTSHSIWPHLPAKTAVANYVHLLTNAVNEHYNPRDDYAIGFSGPGYAIAFDSNLAKSPEATKNDEGIVELPAGELVRSNFAESWIFDIFNCSDDGKFTLSKKIPDSITSYVIQAFSMHPEKGFGSTKSVTKISTHQPFFITLSMPSMATRGEQFTATATVFNYLEDDLTVDITLDNSDGEFDLLDPSSSVQSFDHITKTIKVPINASRGVTFALRPIVIGRILLKFRARSPIAGDTVYKAITIKPEGIPKAYQHYNVIKLNEKDADFKETIKIPNFTNIVSGSLGVNFNIVADFIGAFLFGINENRFNYRTEKCTGHVVWNLLAPHAIMRYLKITQQLVPPVEREVIKDLKSGYRGLQSFRLSDGSFSLQFRYGRTESVGSTSTTAFVMRNLPQLREYIDIDDELIENGLDFLRDQQSDAGDFKEIGEIASEAIADPVTLTANVLLAFVENKEFLPKYKSCIDKGFKYLYEQRSDIDDEFAAGWANYVIKKAIDSGIDVSVHNLAKCKEHRDRSWWRKASETEAKTKEYSGACLFTLDGDESNLYSIIQTLDDYKPSNMEIHLTTEGVGDQITKTLNLNSQISNILQFEKLPSGTQSIQVHAKGSGFAIFTAQFLFNVYTDQQDKEENFNIAAKVKKSIDDLPGKYKLDIYIEYKGVEDKIGFFVLNIQMPSGFVADTKSIKQLRSLNMAAFTRYNGATVNVNIKSIVRNEKIHLPVDIETMKHITASDIKTPDKMFIEIEQFSSSIRHHKIECEIVYESN